MIDDRIERMYAQKIFYLCDPEKHTNCKKTLCQHECKYTLHPDYSKDGKKYKFDVNRWEFIPIEEGLDE